MVAADDDSHDWEPPPDPTQRTWRHPSEIAAANAAAEAAISSERRRVATKRVFTAGALAGAGVCLIGLAALRFSSQADPQLVLQAVATSIPGATAAASSESNDLLTATTAVATTLLVQPSPSSTLVLTSEPEPPMPAGMVTIGASGDSTILANGIAIDGHILTSASALGDIARLWVHQGNVQLVGTIVASDPFSDIAVVRYDSVNPAFLELVADEAATTPDVGSEISLHGIGQDGTNRSVYGALIASGQTIQAAGQDVVGSVETTAELDPILPGALLADVARSPLGMVVNCDSYLAAAIPLADARLIATTLIAHGWANDTWLGVKGVVVERGIKLTEVSPGSPAETAGLVKDDVLLRFDGTKLHSITDLIAQLRQRKPDDIVELVIGRDDDEQIVTAALTSRSLGPTSASE